MKIVVADDEKNILRSLTNFLEDSGHEVLTAKDGLEAIELVRSWGPEVVLMDLRMPRVHGLSALRQISAEQPELPLIVISGVGAVAEAIEAMRLGAWDYLTKPIDDLNLLTLAIEKVMEKQSLRRQVREHKAHLEEQVAQRTAELRTANAMLEQKAIVLREVLNTIQEEKRAFQSAVVQQFDTTVIPLIQRAKQGASNAARALLEQVEKNLGEITSPFVGELSRRFAGLTPSEVRICQAIRRGMSSKEVAQAEGISVDTVDTHRKNIRRKLNIVNEQVNLAAYLQSLEELG